MSGANFPPIVAWNLPATSGFLNLSRSNLSLDWVGFFIFFRRTRKVIITRTRGYKIEWSSACSSFVRFVLNFMLNVPIPLYNQTVLLRCLVNDFLELPIKVVNFIVIMSRCCCIDLYDGDIERSCSQADIFGIIISLLSISYLRNLCGVATGSRILCTYSYGGIFFSHDIARYLSR